MTAVHEEQTSAARARVHDAALRLFAEHGVSGTSLQMIADELGVTKAAVYWHYRSKDDIVLGVITPHLEKLADVVETARARRGRRARVETVVTGLADLVVRTRRVYVVLTGDPVATDLLHRHETLHTVGDDLLDLLTGPEADDTDRVAALMFLAGVVGPLRNPACASIPDDDLRELLVENGRRLLLTRSRARH